MHHVKMQTPATALRLPGRGVNGRVCNTAADGVKATPITRENIEKIKTGMTEEEVEAIFAVPAGVHGKGVLTGTYGLVPWVSWNATGLELIKKQGGKEWVGEDCGVYVRFDEVGRVNDLIRGNYVINGGNESFLDKLRRWLGM
jgi:hypothetical protein